MATTLEVLTLADKWLHFAFDPPKMTLTAAQKLEVTEMLKLVDEIIKHPAPEQDMPASMRMPMTTNPPQGMI